MKNSPVTIIHRLIALIGVFCCLLLIMPAFVVDASQNDSSFWVEFIDVGQGDSALIQCDGHYMIIDGGPSKSSSTVYSILKKNNVDNIDIMVATHPDEDHIGGLSGALNYAKVGIVLSPVTDHDTKTFKSLLKYVNKQVKNLTVPKEGDQYSLGTADVRIIGPVVNGSDTNNKSIIVWVTYGSNSFVFMGDAEDEEESSILKKYSGLDCDVLKVGHHGSKSSTSNALLKATKPEYAVISVGKEKSYSHPNQETIDKLTKIGAQILRTDLQGDIIFYSDGKNLKIETERNASSFELTSGGGQKTSGTSGVGNDLAIPQNTKYVINANSEYAFTRGG